MMSRQWVLVTGGSRGIGRAVVEELAQKWNVIFTWHSDAQRSDAVVSSCKGSLGWVKGVRCDGTDTLEVSAVAAELLACYGAPFAIIHNAGITQDDLHIKHTALSWQLVIETNLNAVFYWNHHLLPAMVESGEGAIVLMSSVSAIKGNVGQTAYGASKAAMIGMSRSLALELGRFGIRVNCLLPGLIESDMTRAMPVAELKELRKKVPLRRLGKAQEVAQAVSFMIGDGSSYMTGQILVLDGGLTA